jgi:hypothetical protein
MMRLFLLTGLVICMAAGCSSMKIDFIHDADANFKKPRTYEWMPRKTPHTVDSRVNEAFLGQAVTRATEYYLATKGYSKALQGASYRLGYHLAIKEHMDIQHVNGYYGYRVARGPGWRRRGVYPVDMLNYDDTYEVGTLILDVVDAASNQLIWRGTATARLNLERTYSQKGERIRAAIKKILEGFPPAQD